MLTRRNLSVGLVVAATGSSCGGSSKPSLRTVHILLSPERVERLLRQLRVFAREHGFAIAVDSLPSSIGTDWIFEMRRRDIWVSGVNPLKDIPADIPLPPSGNPRAPMQVDQGKFVVGFYRGDIEPTMSVLDSIVDEFISSVESVLGVTATLMEQSNE